MEIWKDIEQFEGKYQISTWGRVRNAQTGTILKPYTNSKGYLKVYFYKDGKKYKMRINRLVAQAFIPNPHNLPQVNHKDGNKENNSYTNLEWMTNRDNTLHAINLRKGVLIIYG